MKENSGKLLPDGYTLMFLSDYGSHLYGTATESSDHDFKGVFIPSLEDTLLNNYPEVITRNTSKDKNTSEDIDIQLLSIQKFMRLLMAGDTLAIDLIHASSKPDSILVTSKAWENLYYNRGKFYSKNFKAFLGYAKNQAYLYGDKGDKLKVVEDILEVFRNNQGKARISEFWDELPITNHSRFIGMNSNGIEQYRFCGKIIQSSCTFDYSLNIVQRIYNRYGERSKKARDSDGCDWKALSHALRAYYEVKEILNTGDLKFPLMASQFLRDVKLGMYDYKYITSLLEDKVDSLDDLISHSEFSDMVTREDIDKFTLQILKETYKLGAIF